MSDNPERVNFYKMITFITDIGTNILLEKFYQFVPKQHVNSYFLSKKTEIDQKRKKKNFMDQVQYDQLYPESSDPNPNNYDITLLVKLLSNLFPNDVAMPVTGWVDDPAVSDESLGADLIRIRKIRNEIVGHSARACLSPTEFQILWKKVEVILKRIAKSVNAEMERQVENDIKKLQSTMLMDMTDLVQKLDVLSLWQKEDSERYQNQLDSIMEKLEKMDSSNSCRDIADGRLETSMEEQFCSLKQDFANVASALQVQEVYKKVESMHGTQDEMCAIVKEIWNHVEILSKKSNEPMSGVQNDSNDGQVFYRTDHVPSYRICSPINVRPGECSLLSSSFVPSKKNHNSKYAVDIKGIDKWSSMIGREWDKLKIYLDLTEEQNYQVTEMYPRNVQQRIFTMLKGWHDVVVECGEDPTMLLAAAFVQADQNYEKAHKLVPRDMLNVKLEAKPLTKDRIKKIVFGYGGNNQTGDVYKGGDGAVNVFPGATIHMSASNQSLLNSYSSSTLKSQGVSIKPPSGGEFKKSCDDTLSQSMVGSLLAHMEQVGVIVKGPDPLGTVFRVGSKYIMTAYHVIKSIVDPLNRGQPFSQLLTKDTVCINFNESPIQHSGIVYRLTDFLFFDVLLDIAVLELANFQTNINPFRLCKNITNVENVSIIGYGHPRDPRKHLDPKCPIVPKESGIICSAHASLRQNSQYYKSALINFGKDADLVDLAYHGYDSDSKLIMHCFMEHGASGSPLLTNTNPNSVEVVGVLTHGLPVFYFKLPQQVQINFENTYRFEMATRMDKVYDAVVKYDQNLANDLYGTC